MKRALLFLSLLPVLAFAQGRPSGGVCSLSPTTNAIAKTYTATATSGTAFQCTGDPETCLRVGTHPRATIGPCEDGSPDICFGPNDFGFTSKGRLWGDFTAQTFVARTLIDIQGPGSYLTNNNGPLNLFDSDGIVINNTTALKGRVAASVTFDSAAIGANTCNPQTITVAGAALHDHTGVTADFQLPVGVSLNGGRVTEANTVELNLCNSTGGSLNPDSGPFLVELTR